VIQDPQTSNHKTPNQKHQIWYNPGLLMKNLVRRRNQRHGRYVSRGSFREFLNGSDIFGDGSMTIYI
jgi:hypothetical protein